MRGRSERISRDSTALAFGSIVNGLGAYAFVVIGTRSMGADDFAPVALLWGFWAFSGAALGFPIQHWVIRQIRIDGNTRGVAAALPGLLRLTMGVAVAQGLVAWALADRLFRSSAPFWPLAVVVLALGTAFLGAIRGTLAGAGRYRAAAAAIGGENIVRVIAGLAVLGSWATTIGFASALLTGPLVGLVWWRPGWLTDRLPSAPAVRLAGASGVGLVLAQFILHGGPILLGALDASPADITILFSTLALFRAPYLVGLGLTLRVTGVVTGWMQDRRHRPVRRFTVIVVVVGLSLAAAAGAIAAVVGPGLVAGIFGPEVRPSVAISVAAAAGSVVATTGLWLVVGLVAVDRGAHLVASWVAGTAAFAIVVVLGLEPLGRRVAMAFVVAEVVAFVGLAGSLFRWRDRDGPSLEGTTRPDEPEQ